jgi:polysaccharide biosynthesis protein PslA
VGAQERIGMARWRPSRARLRWRLFLLLAVTDATAIGVAHLMAGGLRFGDALHPEALRMAAAMLTLFAAGAFATEAYAVPVLLAPGESVRRALRALATALTAAVFFLFLLQLGAEVSRILFATAGLFAVAGLSAGRWFVARNARALLGGEPYDVVVINDGAGSVEPAGCTLFVDAAAGFDPADRSPGAYERLGALAEHADRVIVACPPERRPLWAAMLQGANVQAEVCAPELAPVHALGVARHGGEPTLIVAQTPLSLRDRLVKRGFDLVVASALLAVFALPMLAAAAAIRWSSPGPALFRQSRIGRRNRPFHILKFRTMASAQADPLGHRSTERRDGRVTRVGRWLRATSFDELPNLFNVLGGEMSMVGPRPHAVGSRADDRLFWEVDARYWHRHAIKPGLTGLAQVRGLRGATAARADLVDRLHADLEYRSGWTIWRDIAILLRTAPVLFHRNAF